VRHALGRSILVLVTQFVATVVRRLGINAALGFVIGTKVWQFLALPITLALMYRYLEPSLQGYYFTFLSLVALQAFFDLGLHLVLLAAASHESARVRLGLKGVLIGDAEGQTRLLNLAYLAMRWYAMVTVAYIVLVGLGGFWFLANSGGDIPFGAPWFALVAVSGAQLFLSSINYLLEGCGEVVAINRMRLWQSITGSGVMWLLLVCDMHLWLATGAAAGMLILNAAFLLRNYPLFLWSSARSSANSGHVSWRREIWPMQWRLGIQGAVNYLLYYMFNPVMFYYYGPVEAGRMGMTLQLFNAVQSVAVAWVQSRAYSFGRLASSNSKTELDREWRSSALAALIVGTSGNALLVLAIAFVVQLDPGIAGRVLPLFPSVLLALAFLLSIAVQCMVAYTRAYKREPFALVGTATSLATGLAVWQLGRAFGATGAAAAYLLVHAVIAVPGVTILWLRERRALSALEPDAKPVS